MKSKIKKMDKHVLLRLIKNYGECDEYIAVYCTNYMNYCPAYGRCSHSKLNYGDKYATKLILYKYCIAEYIKLYGKEDLFQELL